MTDKQLMRKSQSVIQKTPRLQGGIKRILFPLFVLLVTSALFLHSFTWSSADPNCESNTLTSGEIDECIQKLKRDAEALAPAHENNKKELTNLQSQLVELKRRIETTTRQIKNLENNIVKREGDLSHTRTVFEKKASEHYKFLRVYDPLMPFLMSGSASNAFLGIAFRERTIEGDRQTMDKYAQELLALKNDRDNLAKSKDGLASLQKNVDERAKFMSSEVSKVENYLAELDSRQEELLALKAGGFSTSIGETPPTLEPCSGAPGTNSFCDPGFRPAFAGFSFGAPHRTGMSQYGAYGRSKSGQNADTILAAYFQGATLRKDFPVPATIGVTGHGRISFEENYMLGIYEVPESWGNNGGFEALKAQAVAARSYALAQTNNGAGTICPTESCQVYKPQLKSGKWAEAVRATRGWVLIRDGQPARTYFSASTGGYTISQWGWTGIKDTNGDWPGGAYEKISGSPWFYKGWYKSRSGAACGRSGPWLTSEQMADILNAWKVLYQGGGDTGRVSPPDTSCWKGNPYSQSELQGIGGFTSVSSVSVIYNGSGSTQTVNFTTNKGSVSMSGEELKRAFNLRAPGNLGIKSSLFNIEKL